MALGAAEVGAMTLEAAAVEGARPGAGTGPANAAPADTNRAPALRARVVIFKVFIMVSPEESVSSGWIAEPLCSGPRSGPVCGRSVSRYVARERRYVAVCRIAKDPRQGA